MIADLDYFLVVSLAGRSVSLASKPPSQASCLVLFVSRSQIPHYSILLAISGERRVLACNPFPDNLLQGRYDKSPGNVQISYSVFRNIFTTRHRHRERSHSGLNLLCLKSNFPVLSQPFSR